MTKNPNNISTLSLKKYYIFFSFFSLFLVAVIAVGIYIIGDPFEQRLMKYDRIIEDRLVSIYGKIDEYYRVNNRLPSTIFDSLNLNDEYDKFLYDQAKSCGIEYKVVSNREFELCAAFKTSNYPICFENFKKKECENNNDLGFYGPYGRFLHKEGYSCKSYDVFGYQDEPKINIYDQMMAPTID